MYCCEKLRHSVKGKNIVPINVEYYDDSIIYSMEYSDAYVTDSDANSGLWCDMMLFCPFCGASLSNSPETNRLVNSGLCDAFVSCGFSHGHHYTPLFEYNHKEHKFYVHARAGFGEIYIPIGYCIYCGELLTDSVLHSDITSNLRPDEWWKKRGL